MVAPAAETQIATQFHLTNSTEIATTISIFVLGYGAPFAISSTMLCLTHSLRNVAFGPLALGPLSEIYGRTRILQGANLFYLG